MELRSDNGSDTQAFGQMIRKHIAQLYITYDTTYLVTDSALYNEENL
jgi:hypothetical protein